MHYQNESKSKGVYARNDLPKTMKDWAYVINLNMYKSVGTHWIAFYVTGNSVTYFQNKNQNIGL